MKPTESNGRGKLIRTIAPTRSTEAPATAAWLLLTVLLLLGSQASGQLYTGSIAGTVTDPSGAVVPGAKVKAVDQDKGFSFPATTDSGGRYVVRQLPPGRYMVSVEAAGFQTSAQRGSQDRR